MDDTGTLVGFSARRLVVLPGYDICFAERQPFFFFFKESACWTRFAPENTPFFDLM